MLDNPLEAEHNELAAAQSESFVVMRNLLNQQQRRANKQLEQWRSGQRHDQFFKWIWLTRPAPVFRFVFLQYPRLMLKARPYLCLIHALFSVPFSVIYFCLTWTLLSSGILLFIFGIGILLLVLLAFSLRLMIVIELFSARWLLGFSLHRHNHNHNLPHSNSQFPSSPQLQIPAPPSSSSLDTKPLLISPGKDIRLSASASQKQRSASTIFTAFSQHLSAISSRIHHFIFSADTGYGILYSVIKLPVSIFVAISSLALFVIPLYAVLSPLQHGACTILDHYSLLQDPGIFLFSTCLFTVQHWFGDPGTWMDNLSHMLLDSVPASFLTCAVGLAFLPICIHLISRVSRLSEASVLLLGDDEQSTQDPQSTNHDT